MMVVRIWRCAVHKGMPHKLLDGDDTPRCSLCRLPLECISYGTDGPQRDPRVQHTEEPPADPRRA